MKDCESRSQHKSIRIKLSLRATCSSVNPRDNIVTENTTANVEEREQQTKGQHVCAAGARFAHNRPQDDTTHKQYHRLSKLLQPYMVSMAPADITRRDYLPAPPPRRTTPRGCKQMTTISHHLLLVCLMAQRRNCSFLSIIYINLHKCWNAQLNITHT